MNDMTSTLASTPVLSVWTARIADAASLERLAALNDLPRPSGPALIGAADGRVVAALSLGGGPVLSDPSESTDQVVALLRARAAQLAERARLRSHSRWRSARSLSLAS